jgi:RimJ/RimL family protein N-acetyltransferase
MGYKNRGNNTVEIGIKICDFEKQEKGFGTQLLRMLIVHYLMNSVIKR